MHRPSLRTLAAAAAATLGLTLTGCGATTTAGAPASAGYPLTVADCGRDVTIDSAPQRVLTIGTAAVELLDAAGASDRVVARTGEFGAPLPADLKNPPSDDLITDPSDPTTEEIIAAEPDLVLGYGLFNADAQQLADTGIALLNVQAECGHDGGSSASPATLSTVSDDVRRLGTVFSTSSTADAAADALDQRVSDARRDTTSGGGTGRTAAWVYYFSSQDPLSAYGGGGLPASVLEDAGLTNVYAGTQDAYLNVSVESLLEHQPHWIVLGYGLYGESAEEARAAFLAEPGVEALEAVSAGRIVLLPAGASSSSPTAVAGLEQLVSATAE